MCNEERPTISARSVQDRYEGCAGGDGRMVSGAGKDAWVGGVSASPSDVVAYAHAEVMALTGEPNGRRHCFIWESCFPPGRHWMAPGSQQTLEVLREQSKRPREPGVASPPELVNNSPRNPFSLDASPFLRNFGFCVSRGQLVAQNVWSRRRSGAPPRELVSQAVTLGWSSVRGVFRGWRVFSREDLTGCGSTGCPGA